MKPPFFLQGDFPSLWVHPDPCRWLHMGLNQWVYVYQSSPAEEIREEEKIYW